MKKRRFKLGDVVEVVDVDHRLFGLTGKIIQRSAYVDFYLVRFSSCSVVVPDQSLKVAK